ncbi:helix-turn-helix domain-containing protein [Amedibacillus dolichus]
MRKAKNMTQKELGDQLFVSDKTISKWENGVSQTKGY